MENKPASGFREIEHTADWEMEVWAPDLPALLEQAARGMYVLAGVRLASGRSETRRLALQASDAESLLVSFLSELLYIGESEGLAFDRFNMTLSEQTSGLFLQSELHGALLAEIGKEIKAVTYHRLTIRQTTRGLEANIVLDV